jgi:hypothetical protein
MRGWAARMRAPHGLGLMKRRDFIAWLTGAAAGLPSFWPLLARGQALPPSSQTVANNSVGQVASVNGSATVTWGNAGRASFKVADEIYLKDVVQTDLSSSLGITFDDQTTFSLSANTRIVIDAFVYKEGGAGNNALFNVATGTVAASSFSTGKALVLARSRRAPAPFPFASVLAIVSPPCLFGFLRKRRRAIAASCSASMPLTTLGDRWRFSESDCADPGSQAGTINAIISAIIKVPVGWPAFAARSRWPAAAQSPTTSVRSASAEKHFQRAETIVGKARSLSEVSHACISIGQRRGWH